MEKLFRRADQPRYAKLEDGKEPLNSEGFSNDIDEDERMLAQVFGRPKIRGSWERYNFLVYVIVFGLLVTSLLSLFVQLSHFKLQVQNWETWNASQAEDLSKPEGIPVIGVIFYGRRETVDILDCYLQQNLAKNGGFFDQIIFLQHTPNEQDVAWLDQLVQRVPEYTKIDTPPGGWDLMWTVLDRQDAIYIKIDDDVSWIHTEAISRIVHTLLRSPSAYAVSANMINSPEGNWLHYHTGAILPFLPERVRPIHPVVNASDNATENSWRISELPMHTEQDIPDSYELFQDPPYPGHRWLPLPDNMRNLHRTPIEHAQYHPWGDSLHSWAIAAQQHYSLLSHIEEDDFSRYYLGGDRGVWNMQWERYSINMVAIRGSSIHETEITADDEVDISMRIPRETGRAFLVDTHALAAHFSFGGPGPMVRQTDLMERYRNVANELVCAPDNQKRRFLDLN